MKTKTRSRSFAFLALSTAISFMLFGVGIFVLETKSGNLYSTASAKLDVNRAPLGQALFASGPGLSNDRLIERSAASVGCPSPTQEVKGTCFLTEDHQIGATLVLPSNATLDCRFRDRVHTLSPTRAGKPAELSQPQVGILLDERIGRVTIQNCTIDGFDFGIFAINTKVSPPPLGSGKNHQIIGNTINARFVDISLMHVDDTLIQSNHLTFKTVGGRGIVVERDSDRNRILDNEITASFEEQGAFRVPGATGPRDKSNPLFTMSGAAILVGQLEGSEPTLLNVVVNNTVHQVITTFKLDTNADSNLFFRFRDFTENNLVERNIINIPFPLPSQFSDATDGIALTVAQRTVVGCNSITGALNSIRVGSQFGSQGNKDFPGKCSLNKGRFCLSNTDCKLPFETVSGGTCKETTNGNVNWLSNLNAIEDNQIFGSFGGGVTVAGRDTSVSDNTITGPQRSVPPPPANLVGPSPARLGAITLLGSHALETTIVTRNVVSNVTRALSFQSFFSGLTASCINACSQCPCTTAPCLGAQVSFNDFIPPYVTAVETDNAYGLFLSVLSVDRQGNFWGSAGFSPGKVQTRSAGQSNKVTDCAPLTSFVNPAPCP